VLATARKDFDPAAFDPAAFDPAAETSGGLSALLSCPIMIGQRAAVTLTSQLPEAGRNHPGKGDEVWAGPEKAAGGTVRDPGLGVRP